MQYLILSKLFSIIKMISFMINKMNIIHLLKVCLLFFILTFFNQCGIWDPADARSSS